jgi:hypothetical protein
MNGEPCASPRGHTYALQQVGNAPYELAAVQHSASSSVGATGSGKKRKSCRLVPSRSFYCRKQEKPDKAGRETMRYSYCYFIIAKG